MTNVDLTSARMEQTIRTYFDGCNAADVAMMRGCFTPDAVHYFPGGMAGGPWRGSDVIAANWARLVMTIGSAWSIDRMLCDPDSRQAVIEWTHYKTAQDTYLRGDEWYVFDAESGLINEIRAYYAAPAPQTPPRAVELVGFDYGGRGYHLECPVPRPHPGAGQPAPGA